MALREVFLGEGWYKSVEPDSGKYFASDTVYGEFHGNWSSSIFHPCSCQGYDDDIAKILWKLVLLRAEHHEA